MSFVSVLLWTSHNEPSNHATIQRISWPVLFKTQQVCPDFAWIMVIIMKSASLQCCLEFWEKKEVAQYWIWWGGRVWNDNSSVPGIRAQTNQSERVWGICLSAIWNMFRLSFKMLWSDPNEIPNLLATSQIVIILFSNVSSCTQSTFSPVLLVGGHPWYLAYSAEVTHYLYLENDFKTCALSTVCSSEATFSILQVSITFSLV